MSESEPNSQPQPSHQSGPPPRYQAPPPGAPRYQSPPPNAPRSVPGAAPQPEWHAQQPPQQWQQQAPYPQPYPVAAVVYPPAGPGEPFNGAADPSDLSRPLYGATMPQAFVRFFKNYATFTGRASRSEFWWMTLCYWIIFFAIALAAAFIDGVFSAMSYELRGAGDMLAGIIGLVAFVFLLGTLVPWLALGWRRLHDANLAGPLYLLNLVYFFGSIVVLVFTLLPPRPEGRRFDSHQR